MHPAFMATETKKKARRRGKRRLSFEAKINWIVYMMDTNAGELTRLRGVSGWGFRMSQIADMITYAPSTALLNDLLRACDEGSMYMRQVPRSSNGRSDFEYWFYTPDEFPRALKQERF